MKTKFAMHPRLNQGFALVVVLLLMVALSMVGVASLRSVSLQEKMAGNIYFRSIAFQEAEGALRTSVAKIDKKVGLTVASSEVADSASAEWKTFIPSGSQRDYWAQVGNWSNTGSRSVIAASASGLSLQSTAEHVGNGNQMPTCERKTGVSNACLVMFTRMTAKATDPQTGATAVVQQYFSFPVPK